MGVLEEIAEALQRITERLDILEGNAKKTKKEKYIIKKDVESSTESCGSGGCGHTPPRSCGGGHC